MNVAPRLFRQHPAAKSGPIDATRRFETRARTRGEMRRLTCSVHYARAGDRILLTMKCRDYRNDGMNYTELQDEE